MGTSYSFKISETTVYICPFKTNYIKIKTIFSWKVTFSYFFLERGDVVYDNCWPELCPLLWLPLSLMSPHMDMSPIWWKKPVPWWFKLSKIKIPCVLGRRTPWIHMYWKGWGKYVRTRPVHDRFCGFLKHVSLWIKLQKL